MKVYEVALEKIKEYNKLVDKSNKVGRWGALIMLLGYILLSVYSDNILLYFGSTPETISEWERKIPLIWMLISVLTFTCFFIRNVIQRARLDHKYAYYFKYSKKEINKFLSWKKQDFDTNTVRNHIKKIVNKQYGDKNKLVDELMIAIDDNGIKTELYHINDYKRFLEKFDVED